MSDALDILVDFRVLKIIVWAHVVLTLFFAVSTMITTSRLYARLTKLEANNKWK